MPDRLTASVPEKAWRDELETGSVKFHVIAAWVAVVFVPVFGITDYLNIPDHWHEVFSIRLFNSAFTLLFIINRKRWNLNAALFAAIPFLFISLQNAFTFRYLGEDQLVQHALNYIALMIGAGMFLMWDLRTSLAVLIPSAVATVAFAGLNPRITAEAYFENGGLLVTSVGVFMAVVIEFRRRISIREIKATLALKAANLVLAEQKAVIEAKNTAISDSIQYAKRLQTSMLGNASPLGAWFTDHLFIFLPKDVLSGDFYWFNRDERTGAIVVVVADCTGHGVPAAMMTVMGQGLLGRIVTSHGNMEPEAVLAELDNEVIASFARDPDPRNVVHDGMDMGIVVIDNDRLRFAGAKVPLVVLRANGTMVQVKGSRYPVGSMQYEDGKAYDRHDMRLAKGDRVYMYSDGLQDQFGGADDRKFRTRTLLDLITSTAHLPMQAQQEAILRAHLTHRGQNEQTDDVLMVGFEV